MTCQLADLHTHTVFSDGKLTVAQVAAIARDQGLAVGIADHCGQGSFQISSDRRFDEYLRHLALFPVYRSAELDLGREITVSLANLKRCDYLVGGVHSIGDRDFFDPGLTVTDVGGLLDEILEVIELGARKFGFQILAHPGLLPLVLRDRQAEILDARWSGRLVALAKKYDLALEISSRWLLPEPPVLLAARKAGVRFALGSDGHHADRMCKLDHSLEMMRVCGITTDLLFQPVRQAAENMA
jgi:histidinol phosphatase-like PHP family hydrolase